MAGSAKWDELNDRIARLSVTESSRDGTVRVTVAASGVLTGLVLRDGAVAAQVMECLARAQARIPDLLGRALFETVGPNDPAAELVVADARKRFPEPAPRAAWQPRRQRVPDRVDDDWDGQSVMEDGI
ncbi:YbaB/EbfC family nucleoid-associated protein [Lentzea terrae]|uniref:YbaB/EbfC family nucleoid-associated protein n=1 Tax=Lentzea terrae TaxID=2200761 RepID=UPI000DD30BDE|nr:YbaB/EbfC family nucleoid-associated protein [Lentzea terrae]